MATNINTYFTINWAIQTGKIILLILVIFILESNLLYAQNNILYVKPTPSANTAQILFMIENKIKTQIPNVKDNMGIRNYKNADIAYTHIIASPINYTLKLDNIKDAGSAWELEFTLAKINLDNLPPGVRFNETKITWDNSTYSIGKSADVAMVIDEVLSDVNEETEYYFKNGSFRSRIYINPKDFKPTDQAESKYFYINFSDWLEQEFNDQKNSSDLKYIIFYDDKPYPQDTTYMLYGKFTNPENATSDVEFFIIRNNKLSKAKTVKNIYMKDFEDNELKNTDKYRDEVMKQIENALNK